MLHNSNHVSEGKAFAEMASDENEIKLTLGSAEVVPEEETQQHKDERFRTLYSNPPDFKQIAALDADFAAVVKGRDLDFKDPKAVLQLSKTLLKLDFGLSLDLPSNRLCPPIPNRHNYILWLKDLLDSTTYDAPGGRLVGIDIGTGASCIYPMLGCTQRPWYFIAADIDDDSLSWAKKNVEQNDLQTRIQLVRSDPNGPIIPISAAPTDDVAFVMTNPPFYKSAEELDERAAAKSLPPRTACTGAPVEMVTDGGEVAFVGRILDESLVLRGRVQWYTAMLGFLSSVTALVHRLRAHDIGNYAVTELVQGKKTRRWVVAWSFRAMRPPQAIARGTAAAGSLKGSLPAHTEVTVADFPGLDAISKFAAGLQEAMDALETTHWAWDRQKLEGTLRVADKVWTRAWRRQRQRSMDMGLQVNNGRVKEEFGFGISIHVNLDSVVVRCRWIEGLDESAFISFTGYLKTTAKNIYDGLEEKQPEKPE